MIFLVLERDNKRLCELYGLFHSNICNFDFIVTALPGFETRVDPWRASIEHQVEGDETTPGKYTMNIPLGRNIGPEDVKVSLKDQEGLKVMTVEAKKERKSPDGNSRVYQEYMRYSCFYLYLLKCHVLLLHIYIKDV